LFVAYLSLLANSSNALLLFGSIPNLSQFKVFGYFFDKLKIMIFKYARKEKITAKAIRISINTISFRIFIVYGLS